MQDFRFALRMLRQSPGFAAIAILSLALGIGANTAIFTLVNAALLRPPAGVREPATLAQVWTHWAGRGGYGNVSYPNYIDTRDQTAAVFDGLACYSMKPLDARIGNESERLSGMIVSANYFSVLGAPIEAGRTLGPEDERGPGNSAVAVISHGYWQRRFGGDRAVIGRTVSLNSHPFTIVGVAGSGFHGMYPIAVDVWVPVLMSREMSPRDTPPWERRGMSFLQVIGRLKPGVSIEQAEARLQAVSANLASQYPKVWSDPLTRRQGTFIALPGTKSTMPPAVRQGMTMFLTVLMAVVGLVLLIACANVANLLLARSAGRSREIAIRLSLGASRARIVRQLLTEYSILAIAGGALALVLATWTADLLLLMKPPVDVPLAVDLSLDWRVFAFTMSLALGTALIFGLAPALASTRPGVAPALKDSGSVSVRFRRFGLRNVLTASQAALSILLLITAGLFVRSLGNAQAIDVGFNPRNLVVMPVDISRRPYTEDQARAAQQRIVQAARQMPGVQSVGLVNLLPLSMNESAEPLTVEGEKSPNGQVVNVNRAGPGYFRAMEMPLLAGRGFEPADGKNSRPVAVVNQEFARRHWPGQNPIGKRLALEEEAKNWIEVVGVLKDGKYVTLGEDPTPFVFIPAEQDFQRSMYLVVRTGTRAADSLVPLRKTFAAADPDLPLQDLMTMEESMGAVLLPARLAGSVLGAFGVLALVLAAVGLYGVMAYVVSQRTREMGIRMALGARPSEVMRMVLGRGMAVALTGMVIGAIAAVGLTRFAASMLYGVSPTDPATFLSVFMLLSAVALAACMVPAHRAASVQPIVALRYE